MDTEDFKELQRRLAEQEIWRSQHDGRVNTLWAQRQEQDKLDRENFQRLFRIVTELQATVRMLRQNVLIAAFVTSIVVGALINYLFTKLS